MEQNKIVFNVKPSHRQVERFRKAVPEATFYGSTNMGKKGKSYLIPEEIYTYQAEFLKQFGSKSRIQPFIKSLK